MLTKKLHLHSPVFILEFLILIMLISFTGCHEQDEAYRQEVQVFQDEWNTFFSDSVKSPLTEEDRQSFQELDFFPVNKKYQVTAAFTRTPDEEPFEMPTTTERKPVYVKYGEARFELEEKEILLHLFQNLKYAQSEDYDSHLFLPYTDMTSGNESYGGGRYIDLKIPAGDTIVIDFNRSYNPYCAYNPKYSCPIPPPDNHLDIAIRAGVKVYGKKH